MQKFLTKFLILTIILTAAFSVNYLFAEATPGGNTSAVSDIPTTLSNSAGTMNFASAAQYCANLSESGFDDWRLPTASEGALFAGSTNNYIYYLDSHTFDCGRGWRWYRMDRIQGL